MNTLNFGEHKSTSLPRIYTDSTDKSTNSNRSCHSEPFAAVKRRKRVEEPTVALTAVNALVRGRFFNPGDPRRHRGNIMRSVGMRQLPRRLAHLPEAMRILQ